MKIAVVGSGVSGMGAAWALSKSYDVTLFEAAPRLGGHANTVDVPLPEGRVAVDTGFIVYNDRNYPNLVKLFDHLGVETIASEMSFAVSLERGSFEYAGSLGGLFAQKRNLLRPRMWAMTKDILRFFKEGPAFLEAPEPDLSLHDYLAREGYSEPFIYDHLLPMAGAIWSCSLGDVMKFPAVSFLEFYRNHGLLQVEGRPEWRTVAGGSRSYIRALMGDYRGQLRLSTPVRALRRTPLGAFVQTDRGEERFDQVVLACHGDQALAILGDDANPEERQVLSKFRYQKNEAILHSDTALMPRRRAIWSSWNYLAEGPANESRAVSVTYWMNRLQSLPTTTPVLVTLNPTREPEADKVWARFSYDHPLFDMGALEAQRQLPDLQGLDRTWFCGSYCGHGFHEDGLQAGLTVAAALGAPAPWADEITPASPSAQVARPLVLEDQREAAE